MAIVEAIAPQSQARLLCSYHPVSSEWTTGSFWMACATSATGAAIASLVACSRLAMLPSEIGTPKKSSTICSISRFDILYAPLLNATMACMRGPNSPVGTPAGSDACVEAPQSLQVSVWSCYSSTSATAFGISTT